MNSSTATLRAAAPRETPAARLHLRVLCVLFFFSGFPALIYQLVWQRALFRIFGVNIESVTIVVTAFMLGLGLGGLVGGWVSKRRGLPLLLLLATIETLTGLFGLYSLSLFERVGDLVLGAGLPLSAVVTLALVVVPTLLMGATLPLLVGHLVRRTGNVGGAVGLLYYVNTLGAGAACLASAIALFPLLGMQGSVLFAVGLNAVVAIGAVAAHVFGRQEPALQDGPPKAATDHATTAAALSLPLVLAMSCISGLVSLSYEIFFFRTISYASGSSPFAFATTLGAFLVGIAGGARVGAEACAVLSAEDLLRRIQRSALVASGVGFLFLPLLSHFAWLDKGVLGVALLLVYLFARQWGIVLPCLAHLGVAADSQAGMRTGLLYLSNIIGSAAGSALTGFLLMNHFGLVQIGQGLVMAGLACAVLTGLGAIRAPNRRHIRPTAIALGALLAGLVLPMASGKVLEALQWKGAPEGRIPFASVVENRSGIITVDRTGTIFGNGAYDGHFNVQLTNDVNGIVRPYALSLFHGAPRDVLMIGLASGSWAQVLANNPEVASLTIVEINPGYVDLVAGNPSVASLLSSRKVKLVTDDGRRWLRQNADQRFDAIVTNATYHFRANATNLLSVEFLNLVKKHLKPGGIVFYNTTDSSRVQRTGCATFGFGARFTNHMLLSSTPIDWNFSRWRRVLEQYRIDGEPILDLSIEAHAAGLSRLLGLEVQTHQTSRHLSTDWIEPCENVLDRTKGQALITDDNMGTEWRQIWGNE